MTAAVADANDLRGALAAGHLRLDHLPIVELGTGRVAGVEALLRWEPAPGTSFAPGAFLAAAERSGLLVDIGRWVLRTGLEEVSNHPGPPLRLSVNLSIGELLHPDLPGAVAAALAETGHPADSLYLEVSERGMSGDLGEIAEAMRRLKDLGVRLSIDDFGVGMSSLAQLQRLPVDELKVDRSFVARMHDDPTSAALVRTVVSLARSLRLTTLAEGVEDEVQERMLLGLRCTAAQGWLYARPHRSVADAVAAVDIASVRVRVESSASALWSRLSSAQEATRIVQSAFDDAPVGMALLDGTGTQLAVNPALGQLLGCAAADLVERSCWDSVHPSDVQADQAAMDAVLRGETTGYTLDERYVDTAGRVHWVEVTVSGAPGEPSGVPGELRLLRQVRSIEDRKRAEDRRRMLAAVVDASADAIVIVGSDGVITHFNPAAEQLTGWRADETVGLTLPESARMVELVQDGEPIRVPRTAIRDRQGTAIPIDITLSPFRTSDDDGASVVGILRDVREQVAAEEALAAQAAELGEANDLLRGFAHRLSHDLQQPLTALAGFLHLLAHRGRDSMSGDAVEWVDAAARSQRRLVEAVDALLQTAVGAQPVLVPVDLASLVDEVRGDLDGDLRAADASLQCDELPPVLGNVGLLRRILVNLVTNSCRYRDPSRPLRIDVSYRAAVEGFCTVVVEDDGPGFADDELEDVFREGHRGSASVGRQGTGTGLAIVRTAVAALDGVVWAEHRPGGGARVCFTLARA